MLGKVFSFFMNCEIILFFSFSCYMLSNYISTSLVLLEGMENGESEHKKTVKTLNFIQLTLFFEKPKVRILVIFIKFRF